MKHVNDVVIKKVKCLSALSEVSVNMSLTVNDDTKIDITVPVSMYYVLFTVQDEFDKYTCVITGIDFGRLSSIKKILENYEKSGKTFALIKGEMENGILKVYSLIPEKYDIR